MSAQQFKKGDRVRVLRNEDCAQCVDRDGYLKPGDIVEVYKVSNLSVYYIYNTQTGDTNYINANDVELVVFGKIEVGCSVVVNRIPYNARKPGRPDEYLERGDIVKVKELSDSSITYEVFTDYNIKIPLDYVSLHVPWNPPDKCTCDIKKLFYHGCSCGALLKERGEYND